MKNQNNTPLWDALNLYVENNIVSFDVPGHKKKKNTAIGEALGEYIVKLDANSMKQLDNIANPINVIKESEILMAEAFKADYAFFLVNGTTHGVQSMIMSACNPGDKVIMPRNVHKSAIKALILSGAVPVYVQPEINDELSIANGITVEAVEEAIKANKDAKAIFVINPTYYGMVSNLKGIIEIAHKNNMLVLVDEAHGAHFSFSDNLPISAMEAGADIAAVSLHKTCGSLTQSSALLINERRLKKEKVKTILNLTQTTSASYLLMASLDIARRDLAINGNKIFNNIINLADYAREEINKIDGLSTLTSDLINNKGIYDIDRTKLAINVSKLGISGLYTYDILRDKYKIQVEFGDTKNILAILGNGDSRETVDELISALKDISIKYRKDNIITSILDLHNPEVVISPREAFYLDKEQIPIEDALGEICGEHIMSYPPGIPIISPGERFTKEMIDYINFLKNEGSMLTGTEDPNIDYIKIVKM
jgi:arginine/lysine/ornithine decarboxylase